MENLLNDNSIVALPFDKGAGFCVMKRQSYRKNLADVRDCSLFEEIASAGDKIALRFEKDIKSGFLDKK